MMSFLPSKSNDEKCSVDTWAFTLCASCHYLFLRHVIMLVQVMAAKLWTTWELMTAHLIQNEENVKKGEDDSFSLVCSLCI